MGGTFDPIHYGHLVAAEGVRYEFKLDRVLFVPAGRPPHKPGSKISEARHRLAMTALAIASNPYFTVSDIEISRPGLSYTIDTVEEVYRRYQPAKVYFITGADAVVHILSWHKARDLLNACRVVAATRPGYDLSALRSRSRCLPGALVSRVVPVEVPALAISSTDIRARVGAGKPIKYLLPETVEEYIYKNRLYQPDLH